MELGHDECDGQRGEQPCQQRMGDEGRIPTNPKNAERYLEQARQDDDCERLGGGCRVFGDQKPHGRGDQDIGSAHNRPRAAAHSAYERQRNAAV